MAWAIPVSAKIFFPLFLSNGRELIEFQAESAVRHPGKIITAADPRRQRNLLRDGPKLLCWFIFSSLAMEGTQLARPAGPGRPPTACWNSTIEAVSIEPELDLCR